MIDPIQLPILLKALDFIFEEGRKILEERRERRKMSLPAQNSPAAEPEAEVAEPTAEITPAETPPLPETKQELLTSKIDEILWQNHELEVRHLVKLLETYSRNYHITSEQYAKWGSALVPPIIVHNMTEAENAVVETLKQLEAVLSKIYKKDIKAIP